ncbi:3-hydroxyacyl-CoA dehydrogenase NAD-binding domain-containing protein [Cyclobacterium jeungdonense]|uniref:3-hydroxyacyl-CoA dehydrogenase NAD-binding domain-containing protein n=1 Tax=Cyclobacterium jeungdonense TaxID=708087 RepID=A0ABT8C9F7_9BACT|nr:3-hydroxyacyl-CoA dehydrogenase NAD-binding domain-containing protein [Cyclobacterium jeungdonense]MDN3688777.1 3-hydroxyacyl-CoA dehydrogenase NAD-binding domain-containing protein [Cyclobacterium jeungdonense]
MNYQHAKIAVAGEGILIPSIILCLLRAGHSVKRLGGAITTDSLNACSGSEAISLKGFHSGTETWDNTVVTDSELIILITPENPPIKRAWLEKVVRVAPPNALLLINTESIPLAELQAELPDPSRLLGLNWVYPAHLTYFAELISTPRNRREEVQAFMDLMATSWRKDPYHLPKGKSIRSKLLAAMAREAFFLIENGYVLAEDIDRACRNDPGYYLPFAGNCRYMDLMGTYVYGLVMKDLNPELSRASDVPEFFRETVAEGKLGWTSGQGSYSYPPEKVNKLEDAFRGFSEEMVGLMQRFPFPDGDTPEEPAGVSDQNEEKLKQETGTKN